MEQWYEYKHNIIEQKEPKEEMLKRKEKSTCQRGKKGLDWFYQFRKHNKQRWTNGAHVLQPFGSYRLRQG